MFADVYQDRGPLLRRHTRNPLGQILLLVIDDASTDDANAAERLRRAKGRSSGDVGAGGDARDAAMLAVGVRAIVSVDVGHQLFDEPRLVVVVSGVDRDYEDEGR